MKDDDLEGLMPSRDRPSASIIAPAAAPAAISILLRRRRRVAELHLEHHERAAAILLEQLISRHEGLHTLHMIQKHKLSSDADHARIWGFLELIQSDLRQALTGPRKSDWGTTAEILARVGRAYGAAGLEACTNLSVESEAISTIFGPMAAKSLACAGLVTAHRPLLPALPRPAPPTAHVAAPSVSSSPAGGSRQLAAAGLKLLVGDDLVQASDGGRSAEGGGSGLEADPQGLLQPGGWFDDQPWWASGGSGIDPAGGPLSVPQHADPGLAPLSCPLDPALPSARPAAPARLPPRHAGSSSGGSSGRGGGGTPAAKPRDSASARAALHAALGLGGSVQTPAYGNHAALGGPSSGASAAALGHRSGPGTTAGGYNSAGFPAPVFPTSCSVEPPPQRRRRSRRVLGESSDVESNGLGDLSDVPSELWQLDQLQQSADYQRISAMLTEPVQVLAKQHLDQAFPIFSGLGLLGVPSAYVHPFGTCTVDGPTGMPLPLSFFGGDQGVATAAATLGSNNAWGYCSKPPEMDLGASALVPLSAFASLPRGTTTAVHPQYLAGTVPCGSKVGAPLALPCGGATTSDGRPVLVPVGPETGSKNATPRELTGSSDRSAAGMEQLQQSKEQSLSPVAGPTQRRQRPVAYWQVQASLRPATALSCITDPATAGAVQVSDVLNPNNLVKCLKELETEFEGVALPTGHRAALRALSDEAAATRAHAASSHPACPSQGVTALLLGHALARTALPKLLDDAIRSRGLDKSAAQRAAAKLELRYFRALHRWWLAWWHDADNAALASEAEAAAAINKAMDGTTTEMQQPVGIGGGGSEGLESAPAAAPLLNLRMVLWSDMKDWQRRLRDEASPAALLRLAYHHAPGRCELARAFQTCPFAYEMQRNREGLLIELHASDPATHVRYLNAMVRAWAVLWNHTAALDVEVPPIPSAVDTPPTDGSTGTLSAHCGPVQQPQASAAPQPPPPGPALPAAAGGEGGAPIVPPPEVMRCVKGIDWILNMWAAQRRAAAPTQGDDSHQATAPAAPPPLAPPQLAPPPPLALPRQPSLAAATHPIAAATHQQVSAVSALQQPPPISLGIWTLSEEAIRADVSATAEALATAAQAAGAGSGTTSPELALLWEEDLENTDAGKYGDGGWQERSTKRRRRRDSGGPSSAATWRESYHWSDGDILEEEEEDEDEESPAFLMGSGGRLAKWPGVGGGGPSWEGDDNCGDLGLDQMTTAGGGGDKEQELAGEGDVLMEDGPTVTGPPRRRSQRQQAVAQQGGKRGGRGGGKGKGKGKGAGVRGGGAGTVRAVAAGPMKKMRRV